MDNFDKDKNITASEPKSNVIELSPGKNIFDNIKVIDSANDEEFNSNLNQKHIFDNFVKGESNDKFTVISKGTEDGERIVTTNVYQMKMMYFNQ